MRKLRLLLLSMLGAGMLLGATGGPALADHLHAVVRLTMRPADKLELGYLLEARVTAADTGKPINEVPVKFYEIVNLFGPREMFIGVSSTDGQGVARVTYLPSELGPQEIVARFPGLDHITFAEGQGTLRATVAAAPYRVEAPPLGAFTSRVPYFVGLLILAVWAVIAFALFGTARGIAVGADRVIQANQKEDTA